MTEVTKEFIQKNEDEKIIEIEIERLRSFKNHPFQVKDDNEMHLLKESIEKYGILTPLIVRPVPDGVYEIIAGHRRRHAAELLGYRKVSALEVTMSNVMSRERIMKEYIDTMRSRYDYILIDCMPSLGMMTINALVASDTVLIPVQAAYLPVKGLQQLIRTISMVKKRLNRKLTIHGILLTMVDFRTNYAKDIASRVRETYGSKISIFENVIPLSVKVAEASAEGKSIYCHCPNGKVSMAYENLTQEVLENEK